MCTVLGKMHVCHIARNLECTVQQLDTLAVQMDCRMHPLVCLEQVLLGAIVECLPHENTSIMCMLSRRQKRAAPPALAGQGHCYCKTAADALVISITGCLQLLLPTRPL